MKVENFFGETLRFSERFSKFSIQQVGESLASKIRRVSTPGSHGASEEVKAKWKDTKKHLQRIRFVNVAMQISGGIKRSAVKTLGDVHWGK
mmetsp:Transcript_28749/g.37109  ORF Transcript_28749/g.37109 Transcript_28749/m.37109 type:complete len:91 (-) Transcript_28749:62-334(-)